MDLLKMLDNRKFPRSERFKTLDLVNRARISRCQQARRIWALARRASRTGTRRYRRNRLWQILRRSAVLAKMKRIQRARSQRTRRPATYGTIFPRSRTNNFRPWTSSNFSIRLMRRIRSIQPKRRIFSTRIFGKCHRWSEFGVPRRCSTTKRWENLPVTLLWQAEWMHFHARAEARSNR